jgi:HEAT repeat protein
MDSETIVHHFHSLDDTIEPRDYRKALQRATEAAEALAATNDPAVISRLITLLDGGYRLTIAQALLNTQGVDALPAVLNAKAHPPDWDDQDGWSETLVGYLPEFGAAITPVLLAMLPDADAPLRREIAEALGDTSDPSVISVLLDLSRDAAPAVREGAAWGMGHFATDLQVAERLQAMLATETDTYVLSAVSYVLHPPPPCIRPKRLHPTIILILQVLLVSFIMIVLMILNEAIKYFQQSSTESP